MACGGLNDHWSGRSRCSQTLALMRHGDVGDCVNLALESTHRKQCVVLKDLNTPTGTRELQKVTIFSFPIFPHNNFHPAIEVSEYYVLRAN